MSPTRVLVAEDDRVARELLVEILRGEGYEVEAVADGDRAIARAGGGATTWSSPTCAWATARAAWTCWRRSPSKRPQTPIILITAFGDVAGAMEAIQRGAYDYVSKPFNVEELRLTVRRALERRG